VGICLRAPSLSQPEVVSDLTEQAQGVLDQVRFAGQTFVLEP
jgi:hypothetical protein